MIYLTTKLIYEEEHLSRCSVTSLVRYLVDIDHSDEEVRIRAPGLDNTIEFSELSPSSADISPEQLAAIAVLAFEGENT